MTALSLEPLVREPLEWEQDPNQFGGMLSWVEGVRLHVGFEGEYPNLEYVVRGNETRLGAIERWPRTWVAPVDQYRLGYARAYSFDPLFLPRVGGPKYGPLLGLRSAEAVDTIRLVWASLDESPDPAREVLELFAPGDWRPHLVAVAAILRGGLPPSVLDGLWRAFDRGSWVAPQLAVAAAAADPQFTAQARMRIETHCSGVGAWSAAKALAALLALAERNPSLQDLAREAAGQPKTVAVLARDHDRGGAIALEWLDNWSSLRSRS